MGREALEDILYRAQLELYSQPILVRPRAWGAWCLITATFTTTLSQLH